MPYRPKHADKSPYWFIGNLLEIVGWSSSQAAQQTYNGYEQTAEEDIKSRLVYLITAIRTLLRSEHVHCPKVKSFSSPNFDSTLDCY